MDDSCGATIEVTCGRPSASASTNQATAGNPHLAGAVTDVRNVKKDGASAGDIGVTTTGRAVDLTGVDVGAVVKVKGGVGIFRGAKQVLLERICTCSRIFIIPLTLQSKPRGTPLFIFSLILYLAISQP